MPTCKHKYLHFFQDNSKKLHLFNLNKFYNGLLSSQEVILNIPFRIPLWHRSIITPEGFIFLTGGSSPTHKEENNISRVYLYDYDSETLLEKSPMNFARNSHGICVFQGMIYVVGGCVDEGGYTVECERLDYKYSTGKLKKGWDRIAPLNQPAFGPCLVNYNNKYLFKIGGILSLNVMNNYIERYDPLQNLWDEINYKINYPDEAGALIGYNLMAYAACHQINSTEVYVFGGAEEESKTNTTYRLKVHDDYCELERAPSNLPYYGTFWNNAIVHNNQIFCLQNVQLNKSEAVSLSKRKILCYKSGEWLEILS